jgi:Xaa-Pro aminopeptidase
MKTDIDALMESHEIDALLVTGPAQHNPAMYYFTGGGHISQADLIKKRGQAPVLFYNSMERDEAAKTGLQTKVLCDYRMRDLLKESKGTCQHRCVTRRCWRSSASASAWRCSAKPQEQLMRFSPT